jgi:hypothetical protein
MEEKDGFHQENKMEKKDGFRQENKMDFARRKRWLSPREKDDLRVARSPRYPRPSLIEGGFRFRLS